MSAAIDTRDELVELMAKAWYEAVRARHTEGAIAPWETAEEPLKKMHREMVSAGLDALASAGLSVVSREMSFRDKQAVGVIAMRANKEQIYWEAFVDHIYEAAIAAGDLLKKV